MEALVNQKNTKNDQLTILEGLFGSESRARVLLVLLTNIGRIFYQRQVEFATQLPLRAIQRELERLSQIGLLYSWKEGNRTWYQLKTDNAIVKTLQTLILSICSPYDKLRTLLHSGPPIRLALLNRQTNEVLVISQNDTNHLPETFDNYKITKCTVNSFLEKIATNDSHLISFLKNSVDLLGNREDLLWRTIEMIAIHIPKGENVL